jgi:catechol 2,3-dioxygenase-like lactoylglutathione lyase family enzyme
VLVVSILLIASSCDIVKAQTTKILGVDHVGINVPDLEQGVKFFKDMFGFVPVTKLGPIKMDAAWKKNFHIHDDSGEVTIVMLRAGNGSNIELFQYKPSAGNTTRPYRDDLFSTHISLYTSDLQASVSYLKSKGIKFLTDPIPGGGDTAGETWVYFESPWGATFELNSYPQGKGYEKSNPAVKLWSPKDTNNNLKIGDMNAADIDILITRHLLIWNEKNTVERIQDIQNVYNYNVNVAVPGLEFSGYEKLNGFIDGLHTKNAGYVFTHQRPIESHHNLARLFWSFGPPSQPNATTGMDVFIIENGRIQALYVFLDDPNK